MTKIVAIFLVAASVLRADDKLEKYFWEPELPGGQAFIAYPRSIKSFRVAKYDISYEGERYPVVELNIELTHGTASFMSISDSEGRPVKPTLKDIADGRFEERRLAGSPPPDEIKARGQDANHRARFLLDSPGAVEKLHHELSVLFQMAFPW
jgi:hypothetical protein